MKNVQTNKNVNEEYKSKGDIYMKILVSNVLMICGIILIGLLTIQKIEAAIPNTIDLGNIMTEIILVSDQENPIPGKYRIDGLRPATIKIDYNDLKNFPIKIVSVPNKINVGNINKEVLDCCLLAIANEPNLLGRIDQRQNFNKDDICLDVLRKTLNNASQFIPYDVNNPAIFNDVNKPADLKVSLCLADSKVYFWKILDDRDVLGWASIQGQQEWETTMEPKLTVWVIPRLDKSTSFINSWSELAKQTDINSRKSLLKLALDLDIKDTNGYIEQLLGRIKSRTNMYHNVKMVVSGNVFQLEINLLSGDGKSLYGGKPRFGGFFPATIKINSGDDKNISGNNNAPDNIQKDERVLKDWSISLPFWPPKIEEKGKETSD